MEVATFDWLNRMRSRHAKEFGKACQLLVAISFCRAGFHRIDERSVQGVDLDIGYHGAFPNFALEVKTTEHDKVKIGEKDVDGLAAKAQDGYKTAFVVLRLGLLSDWVVAKAKGLCAGEIPIGRLEARAIPDLQKELNREFPHVVADYAPELLKKPTGEAQEYLQACLAIEKRKREKRPQDPA